jgi:hypothetical protein
MTPPAPGRTDERLTLLVKSGGLACPSYVSLQEATQAAWAHEIAKA